MQGDLQLVMQDLEHGRRRKKRSVLSKFAANLNQNSLDSVGDDRTSHSDDYGIEGSEASNKLKQCMFDSKNYSQLDETGLDNLNDDEEENSTALPNLADSEKAGFDGLKGDDCDDGGDDIVDSAIRCSPKSTKDLKKDDLLTHMDDLSPKLSPKQQQQQQSLNGGHDVISDSEDEDEFDPEEMGATAAVAKYDKNLAPPTVPPLSTHHSADEAVLDDPSLQADSATSTFSSAMMKVYGLLTRSSQAPSEASIVSGSMAKISTKDARNRFVSCFN